MVPHRRRRPERRRARRGHRDGRLVTRPRRGVQRRPHRLVRRPPADRRARRPRCPRPGALVRALPPCWPSSWPASGATCCSPLRWARSPRRSSIGLACARSSPRPPSGSARSRSLRAPSRAWGRRSRWCWSDASCWRWSASSSGHGSRGRSESPVRCSWRPARSTTSPTGRSPPMCSAACCSVCSSCSVCSGASTRAAGTVPARAATGARQRRSVGHCSVRSPSIRAGMTRCASRPVSRRRRPRSAWRCSRSPSTCPRVRSATRWGRGSTGPSSSCSPSSCRSGSSWPGGGRVPARR